MAHLTQGCIDIEKMNLYTFLLSSTFINKAIIEINLHMNDLLKMITKSEVKLHHYINSCLQKYKYINVRFCMKSFTSLSLPEVEYRKTRLNYHHCPWCTRMRSSLWDHIPGQVGHWKWCGCTRGSPATTEPLHWAWVWFCHQQVSWWTL